MKNFEKETEEKQKLFLKSFDYILWNTEDVLWEFKQGNSDFNEVFNYFNASKKTNVFLADNLCSPDALFGQLQLAGYNIEKSQIIQPIFCIISYLKSINFNKEILVIGMNPLKSELKQAGFKVSESGTWKPNASTVDYVKFCLKYNDKVGAVIVDCDLNMKRATFQNAITHLKNPDTMLIAGGSDLFLRHNHKEQIIGPGFFHQVLEKFTGRQLMNLGKPSKEFGDFIKTRFSIPESDKILIIGKANKENIDFAFNCGFQTLIIEDKSLESSNNSFYHIQDVKTLARVIQQLS